MKLQILVSLALVVIPHTLCGVSRAEEESASERSPVAFEEALPEEPGTMTLRWVSDYGHPRNEGDVSVSLHRAQWFFGLTEGVSGEVELPLMRFQDTGQTTWGFGRAALALKVAPWMSRGWPVALRGEVELPTASSVFPEEVHRSTGAMYLATVLGKGSWMLQADLGFETTWDSADRSLEFDAALIRHVTPELGFHAELVGEHELAGGASAVLAGPGLSLASGSGMTVGVAVLGGLTTESERLRAVLAFGRRF
jgi:hypothetical protein